MALVGADFAENRGNGPTAALQSLEFKVGCGVGVFAGGSLR